MYLQKFNNLIDRMFQTQNKKSENFTAQLS